MNTCKIVTVTCDMSGPTPNQSKWAGWCTDCMQRLGPYGTWEEALEQRDLHAAGADGLQLALF